MSKYYLIKFIILLGSIYFYYLTIFIVFLSFRDCYILEIKNNSFSDLSHIYVRVLNKSAFHQSTVTTMRHVKSPKCWFFLERTKKHDLVKRKCSISNNIYLLMTTANLTKS